VACRGGRPPRWTTRDDGSQQQHRRSLLTAAARAILVAMILAMIATMKLAQRWDIAMVARRCGVVVGGACYVCVSTYMAT
jgi:hypothetical protein